MILFKRVRATYGWCSNMSPHAVDGYATAEALFQASRFKDPIIQAAIRACRSPMTAKMLAKGHGSQMIIRPRSPEDLDLMRSVVRRKVEQHQALHEMLLGTDEEQIVEDVSGRPNESGLFWGAVLEPNGTLRGENHLGRIWMELRSELRKGALL